LITNNNNDSGTGINANFDIATSHNGNIAEFIVYLDVPTALEMEKIHSYLSIKYGLLKQSNDNGATPEDERDYFASNGSVIWDWSANSGYNQRIAGIGRDDGTELNQKKSKSPESGTSLTIQQTGAFATDLSYVVWGSNAQTGIESSAPAGYNFISSAKWKVNVTGTP
jgi:hypothetical protein